MDTGSEETTISYEKLTPFLYQAGLLLDLSKTKHFQDLVRLEEGKTFTNGMMCELRKYFKDNTKLYSLLLSIVPLSLLNDEYFPDQKHFFGGKFKSFETALKRRLSQLETSELEESSSQSAGQLHELEIQLNSKEENIILINENLRVLETERFSLQPKRRGLKSGISRSKMKAEQSTTMAFIDNKVSKDKSTITHIKDIRMKDIIVVDKEEDGIFNGLRYYGDKENHTKTTSGHINSYFEISDKLKPCSDILKPDIPRRAKIFNQILSQITGSSSSEGGRLLLTELIKTNKDIFHDSLPDAGFKLLEVLSPEQAINVQSLLRMPTNKLRNLRICLSKFNANILPSERQIRKARDPMVSHVNEETIDSGFMGLKKSKDDECVMQYAYLGVKDLKKFIEEVFNSDENFGGMWWILFSGDKHRKFTKYHLNIVYSNKAGSVDNVHIYCLFEAQDCRKHAKSLAPLSSSRVASNFSK